MIKMSLRSPLKKKTLQQTVHDAVRDAILIGEVKPGELISLRDVAEKLGVSTMPVRESLRQLEAQGLVTFASQRKILITKLAIEDLHEFYWIRVPLELKAFKRNFENLGPQRLKGLRGLQEKMSKRGITEAEWNRLNRQFHFVLYGVEKSPVLDGALSWLWNNVAPYLAIFARSAALEGANKAHSRLLELIEKRDHAAAEKVLQKHLEDGMEEVGDFLKSEPSSDPAPRRVRKGPASANKSPGARKSRANPR
jgi:DNA-binding GntR family transcriptional regulator